MYNISCKKQLLSFFSLLLFSVPAFSANGHIYASTSFGASFATEGNSSPQISYSNITDAYPLSNNQAANSIFSINAGYEFAGENWRPAIGLGLGIYSNLGDYDYSGQLIETASGLPSSTLYNYNYTLSTARVMAEIQLSWLLGKFVPFINAGIGPSWNKMNSYTETPATSTGFVALPPFQSHTNINLSYQAGFGIGTDFNFATTHSDFPEERVSIGYRYANLGTASFGTRGSVYPYSLTTGILKTNDVYLSYTHLF